MKANSLRFNFIEINDIKRIMIFKRIMLLNPRPSIKMLICAKFHLDVFKIAKLFVKATQEVILSRTVFFMVSVRCSDAR